MYMLMMEEGAGWYVWGVYTTKEKAEAARAKAPECYTVYIEEVKLDDENPFD